MKGLLNFELSRHMLIVFIIPDMHVNDDYGSYTLGYATLEF